MVRRAETEKEGTRPGVLSSDQNLDRPQTKDHPPGANRRSARKRKATEKGAQQDRVRQRKTQARLQKVLPQAPGGYFKPPKRILPKPLGTDTDETKRIQAETGSQEMGPLAHVGGGLSASARWDVQWCMQQRLDECRRRCQHNFPFHFTVRAVIGEADVVVPPEPFPLTRQSLDTLIELL